MLKFENADGSADCTISNVGGNLQLQDASGTISTSEIQGQLSGLEVSIDVMQDNIDELYNHMPCRPGHFRPTTNPFVDENDSHLYVCMVCPGGSYTTEFNFAGTCTACPTGYKHDNSHDHTYCDVCAPGYGFNNGALGASHTFCE